jgi:hypothetical protein
MRSPEYLLGSAFQADPAVRSSNQLTMAQTVPYQAEGEITPVQFIYRTQNNPDDEGSLNPFSQG